MAFLTFAVLGYLADSSHGGRAFAAVCLSLYCTKSQKPMQLGSPNVTYKCSTLSPDIRLFWGQTFKCQAYES